MVPTESAITDNTHVKYQSSSTHCSKVISKVKFQRGGQNDRMTEWQTGQKQYAPDL